MGLGKKNANVEEQIEKVDKQIEVGEPTSEELQSPTSQDVGLLSATQVDQVTMYEGSIRSRFTGRPLGSMVAHLCLVLKLF